MSAFGERISAKTNQNTIRVEVAEWGDENEPMVLFATPLNAGEFSRLQKKHPNFLNNMIGFLPLSLMSKASYSAESPSMMWWMLFVKMQTIHL